MSEMSHIEFGTGITGTDQGGGTVRVEGALEWESVGGMGTSEFGFGTIANATNVVPNIDEPLFNPDDCGPDFYITTAGCITWNYSTYKFNVATAGWYQVNISATPCSRVAQLATYFDSLTVGTSPANWNAGNDDNRNTLFSNKANIAENETWDACVGSALLYSQADDSIGLYCDCTDELHDVKFSLYLVAAV